jgi:GTP-binding protein
VDLPGYGYAKVAESVRQHWRSLLEAYFQQRKSLVGLIITVDIRRGLKDLDHVMMDWAEGAQVPVVVLLTKSDKLSYSARLNCLAKVKKSMPSVTPLILFSAPNKTGVEEARDLLIGWLEYKNEA